MEGSTMRRDDRRVRRCEKPEVHEIAPGARKILKVRLAKGEIDSAEFQQKRRLLLALSQIVHRNPDNGWEEPYEDAKQIGTRFHPRHRHRRSGGQRSTSANRTSNDALWSAYWA
jgi:hypothetical protein